MNRESKHYIIAMMGFTAILLIAIFHLFSTINSLLWSYNNLVDYVNQAYNRTFNHRSVIFFGEGLNDISLIVDLFLTTAISIILAMLILNLYWIVKEKNKNRGLP